ncbi:hypothetical protein OH807_13295 [Kitasatospora sp. NBC_01560]|uniref:hypothetical protein n=1 Tax=Kitasatospora sp. NBC_01560 TaxID=2975965 RepID=UPI00386E6C0A
MTTTSRPARRRTAPLRPAALAAGAVLLLGGGLVACEGGASLCLNDNTCDVVVRTDGGDSARTVEVFDGDRKLKLTVGHITDRAAEVTIGGETKTLAEDAETAVGAAKITLRNADAHDHYAELHVSR